MRILVAGDFYPSERVKTLIEKKEYEKPEVILKRVIDMESEIQQKLRELEEIL